MRKLTMLCFLLFFTVFSLDAQNQYREKIRPTKNVILMIPDGCSLSVYSASRWYQMYNKLGSDRLAVDPYICGVVKTYNSNAPIGDSAPTTSTYMTGYLSRRGYISTYPEVDPVHDIHPVDANRAFQPLATVMEAAKYDLNKSTGLVVTVQFTHATPADCSAHHYNRAKMNYIASQQVANKLDVVFGSGSKHLTKDLQEELKSMGTRVLIDDIDAFRNYDANENLWALFDKTIMPFDIDRDDTKTPSLEEMTKKAIERLSKDENGFFLMVEGSKVDYAAHSNDVATMLTEYLAFDRAVQVAIDFAKTNTETTVIVLSDHGTSGFSIGEKDFKNYSQRGLDDVFGNISKVKTSISKMEDILVQARPDQFKQIVKENTGIDISEEQLEELLKSKNYKEGDYMQVSNSVNLSSTLAKIINKGNAFGFSTGGHTGEDVLLAAYHPDRNVPLGMNTNVELNQYLCDVVGLQRPLDEITNEIFTKHTDVFKGMKCIIDPSKEAPTLTVKNGKKEMVIPAFKSKVYLDGKEIELKSPTVYIDKNNTFYIPRFLRDEINKK